MGILFKLFLSSTIENISYWISLISLLVHKGGETSWMEMQVKMPRKNHHFKPTSLTWHREHQILNQKILNLENKNAVEIVQSQANQFVSDIVIVPKKDERHRPAINLRLLNHFLQYKHFKIEGLFMIRDLLYQEYYMYKIYLKDAYLTIPTHRDGSIGIKNYISFVVLHSVLPPHPDYLQTNSGSSTAAKDLNDNISRWYAVDGKQELIQNRNPNLFILQAPGFIINQEKLVLIPTHNLEFWHKFNNYAIHFTRRKSKQYKRPVYQFTKIKKNICLVLNKSYKRAQKSATVVGQSISPDLVINSDASNIRWRSSDGSTQTGGVWQGNKLGLHINAKELLASFLSVQSFVKSALNIFLQLKMNNVAAVSHINRLGGTRSRQLTKIKKALWDWCQERQIPGNHDSRIYIS